MNLKRAKMSEISVFEIFLCLFVIFIHATSELVLNSNVIGIKQSLIFSLQKMVSFAVYGFIFSSGFKAFYNKHKSDEDGFRYITFMLQRLLKIYLPYLIWVIIYYLCFVFVAHRIEFKWDEFFKYILFGDLAAHFYFIVMIMQFYLLMPFWRFMCKKVSPWIAIPAALVITVLFQVYGEQALKLWFNFETPYLDRVFVPYLAVWVTGCYCGCNYEKFTEIIKKFRTLFYLSALLVNIHIFLCYLNYCGSIVYSAAQAVHVFFCFIMTLAFYLLISDGIMFFEKYMKWVSKIAAVTFYVYLSHILVMHFCDALLNGFEISSLAVRFVIRAFVTTVIPFAGSLLYVYVKKVIKNLSVQTPETPIAG